MNVGAFQNWEALFSSGRSFDRVVVTGANGAGKTWVATRLAQVWGLPVVHNDALALERGWRHRDRQEIAERRITAAEGACWVLDGGPSVLAAEVLARNPLVIWIDLPAGVRARRVAWRSVRYIGRVRPEHPPGNREWPGLRQWRFLRGVWAKDRWFRQVVPERLAGFEGDVVRLQSTGDVAAFVQALSG